MKYAINENERYVAYETISGAFLIHREIDLLTKVDVERNNHFLKAQEDTKLRLKNAGFITSGSSDKLAFTIEQYLKDYKGIEGILFNKFYIISFKKVKGMFSKKGDYEIIVNVSQESDYTTTFTMWSYLRHGKILMSEDGVSGFNNKENANKLSEFLTKRLFLTINDDRLQITCDDNTSLKDHFEKKQKLNFETITLVNKAKEELKKIHEEKIKNDMNENPSSYIESLREENKQLRADLNQLTNSLANTNKQLEELINVFNRNANNQNFVNIINRTI